VLTAQLPVFRSGAMGMVHRSGKVTVIASPVCAATFRQHKEWQKRTEEQQHSGMMGSKSGKLPRHEHRSGLSLPCGGVKTVHRFGRGTVVAVFAPAATSAQHKRWRKHRGYL